MAVPLLMLPATVMSCTAIMLQLFPTLFLLQGTGAPSQTSLRVQYSEAKMARIAVQEELEGPCCHLRFVTELQRLLGRGSQLLACYSRAGRHLPALCLGESPGSSCSR